MENPSLRVSGHASSMNRTFIVEEYAEDDFGQGAKDEVIGEQGYVDDERSCFWTSYDTEGVWQSRPYKGRQLKRREGTGNGKHKGISKRSGRAFLGRAFKHNIQKCGQKRTLLSGTKDAKARKDCQKGGFRPYQPDKGAVKDYSQNKGKGKFQKGKGKEETHPQSRLFQLLKHLKKG